MTVSSNPVGATGKIAPTNGVGPTPASPLAHGADYTGRDWSVLALHTPDKYGHCSCGDLGCTSAGKHPRFHKDDLRHVAHSVTLDPDIIALWEARWPQANIGVATGAGSNIFVLD